VLKFGIVTDYKKGFARVQFLELDIVTDFLPILVKHTLNDKESYPVEINEHVACVMDETLLTGVVLGAIPSKQDAPDPDEKPGVFRKLFKDGSLIEFDRNTGNLKADVTGDANVKAGGKASILAPAIEFTGEVKITGACTITGALAAGAIATTGGGSIKAPGGTIEAADVMAGAVSLKSHKHAGVATGNGTTGPAI